MLLTIATDGREKDRPLTIVGPEGIKAMVMQVFALSGGWGEYYPLDFVEISNARHERQEVVELGRMGPADILVHAVPLVH